MISPLTYHRKIKNERHVFIYCVAGRSSSTAFQRIINSSNHVWIWGEQHGIVEQTITLIDLMKKYHDDNDVKNSLIQMYQSYKTNKHNNFYPNAVGNLASTVDVISSAISNLLKPWVSTIARFGFKDIGINNGQTLLYLKEIFPESLIVFCFRDPLLQWPSVRASGWWPYCNDIQDFLNEYFRLSSIYLEYASNNECKAFVENINLTDEIKVQKIASYLNIPQIDKELIGVSVSSHKVGILSKKDKETIVDSHAYANYLKMKCNSELFFNNLR